ncbi:MAG: hypothetical protein U5O39_06505 [Gammaproteobacteria bacterium]|nr:hypothetical protein [Gammaproteobacteria bacterium]
MSSGGKALFTRHARCGHCHDAAQIEGLVLIIHRPVGAQYRAFGFAVHLCDERRRALMKESIDEEAFLVFLVDPAAFLPDSTDGLLVFFGMVVADCHGGFHSVPRS